MRISARRSRPTTTSLPGAKVRGDPLCRTVRAGALIDGRERAWNTELGPYAWTLGALGAVGSTYNYAAPLYLRMLEALRAGEDTKARVLQDTAIKMIAICNGIGVTHLAASKALMPLLGVDCGPTRLPLAPPTPAQIASMRAQLTTIGFFDLACRAPAQS